MKIRTLLLVGIVLMTATFSWSQATAEEFFELGLQSYRTRDYESAQLYFEKTIEADPAHVNARVFRAAYRRGRKDYQGAITEYTKVIELDPKRRQTHSSRGLMYFYSGNPEAAINDYTKEIEIGGWDWWCYHYIGRAYEYKAAKLIQRGELEAGRSERAKAITSFSKAIAADPSQAESYSWRSTLHSTNADYTQALSDINAALAIRPKFVDDYRRRIWIYRKTSKEDLAKADERIIAQLLAEDRPAGSLRDSFSTDRQFV